MYTGKNQLQEQLPTPAQQNTRGGGYSDPVNQLVGRAHQTKTQNQPKSKDIHRANINNSPTSVSSAYEGDCTTESHTYSITEVYTINPGTQNRSIEEAEANKKSLTNNGKTKKQTPCERTGGSLRKNAK